MCALGWSKSYWLELKLLTCPVIPDQPSKWTWLSKAYVGTCNHNIDPRKGASFQINLYNAWTPSIQASYNVLRAFKKIEITCYGNNISFPRNKNDPKRSSIKVSLHCHCDHTTLKIISCVRWIFTGIIFSNEFLFKTIIYYFYQIKNKLVCVQLGHVVRRYFHVHFVVLWVMVM